MYKRQIKNSLYTQKYIDAPIKNDKKFLVTNSNQLTKYELLVKTIENRSVEKSDVTKIVLKPF